MESKDFINSAMNPDFVYDDADVFRNEIAELYSYTEFNEFQLNFSAFKLEIETLKCVSKWQNLSKDTQSNFILKMIDQLDALHHVVRVRAARCILYLVQGCWEETTTAEEQQELARRNVVQLYQAGLYPSMISLLNIELENARKMDLTKPGKSAEDINVTMNESTILRLVLNVLYTVVETIRNEQQRENSEYKSLLEEFIAELNSPLDDGVLLQIKLLEMVTMFCDGTGPQFPIKKILLLLWKSSLLALGGTCELQQLRNELRAKAGLPAISDDTLAISRRMRATILSDEEAPALKKQNPFKRSKTVWEAMCEDAPISKKQQEAAIKFRKQQRESREHFHDETLEFLGPSIRCSRAVGTSTQGECYLLFESKVRLKDIENFLENARQKFFGFSFGGDNDTLIGLPQPIQESVHALRRHLYVSLAEKQIEAEKHSSGHSLSEEAFEACPAEMLYQALLPKFRRYVTDLLKILVAASPSAKLTAGNLNARIITDMLPKNPPPAAIFSSTMKMDVIRHKEIIVKSITALLLVLLRHFKLNHIYHFEYMTDLLVQASFVELTLQLYAPTMNEYVTQKTSVGPQEFPNCFFERQNDFNSGANFEYKLSYSWRNLFSCINIMRLLNKVIKWKHSRILNMVSLKSTNTLKELLQIRQPLLQIYVLKLLKMQSKYLGRYWRRNNLKVMTAIYTKVRHRFNDDWAYGCDTVAKIWDAQGEEYEMKISVQRFHKRRYPDIVLDCNPEVDRNLQAFFDRQGNKILPHGGDGNAKINRIFEQQPFKVDYIFHYDDSDEQENSSDEELSDYFKQNYEAWLDSQVFRQNFDWDSV